MGVLALERNISDFLRAGDVGPMPRYGRWMRFRLARAPVSRLGWAAMRRVP